MKTHFKRNLAGLLTFVMVASNSVFLSAAETAAPARTKTTYSTITEICDWGAATTKVVVDLKKTVKKGCVDVDTFSVDVVRTDPRIKNEVLNEGARAITNCYVSDEKGNPVESGHYATIEMEVGPTIDLGATLNFYEDRNIWIDCAYTIKQLKEIRSNNVKVTNLEATQLQSKYVPLVDDFKKDTYTYQDKKFGKITMGYATFDPAKDQVKNPLIIWLHGLGEGGTDQTLPISANKAANFASDDVQKIFGGAYVLVPQSPTKWMDDGVNKEFKGADSKYTEALMGLIDEYVKANPDIDSSRIYIGGCSNGGFMTMRMIMSYPDYFAAAFPVCEAMEDAYVTDKDIDNLKNIPIWFVLSKTDTTVLPESFTLPTYKRLIDAGAKNVYLNLFENVSDTTGLYKQADGAPHEYDGHWSWTYVYNDQVKQEIGGKETTLLHWLAAQKK